MTRAFAVLGIVLCLPYAEAIAGSSQLPGLANFHQVNEDVFRGAQPTPDGFRALAALGVKTVIDLRGPEHSVSEEQRAVEADGMRYVSIPMLGMHTPTEQQISAALALMNDAAAGPVFVHCRRGADRTGAVVACYRMEHDHWDAVKSLSEARKLGMSWYQLALQQFVTNYHPVIG